MATRNYLIEFMRGCARRYKVGPEDEICEQFTAYMKEMSITGKCDHVWFHVSNEGSSSNKQLWGMKQRNMGKFAGVSDYVFMCNSTTVVTPNLGLEIKAGKGRLQESQKIFKQWCEDAYVPYRVAWTLEEAKTIVEELCIVKK